MTKKLFIYILCILLLFSFSGCGKTHVPEEKPESVQEMQPDTENDAPADAAVFPEYTEKVAYANWSDEGEIMRSCLNEAGVFTVSSVRHLPVFRFDMASELGDFRQKFSEVLTFDRGYNEMPSFDETAARYDDGFFADRSLLLVYVSASSGSFRYGIDRIEVNEGELCVHITEKIRPEVYDSAMSGWFVMVEIERQALDGITSYDAVDDTAAQPQFKTLPGMIEYGSFSYADIREIIENLPEDNRSAIRTEDFVNTEKAEGFWPADRARAEVEGGDYDLSQTFYDADEDVWMVHFWNSKRMGGDATVYMDGDGVTLLITYGD
ncbi:MAG: hypothetical protein IKE27_01310 [Oscillospiraceae bacterium]|nr:hypothetical protein [Oscillospiraceae bacterium]